MISTTTTDYCDAMPGTELCLYTTGDGDDPTASPGRTRFVRPTTVNDTNFLLSSATLANGGQGGSRGPTDASQQYVHLRQARKPDHDHGDDGAGRREVPEDDREPYGAADSTEERLGKVTLSTVTTQRVSPQDCLATPITHITQFEYGQVSQYASPVNGGGMVGTLGLLER